jgi:hypothetical protein
VLDVGDAGHPRTSHASLLPTLLRHHVLPSIAVS